MAENSMNRQQAKRNINYQAWPVNSFKRPYFLSGGTMNKSSKTAYLKKCLGLFVTFSFYTHFSFASAVKAVPTQLSADEKKLTQWVDDHQDEILSTLEQHVNINTGTLNKEGLDKYRAMLAAELTNMGFTTQTHPGKKIKVVSCGDREIEFASHVSGVRGSNPNRRIFLNGHMDTVFAKDNAFQKMTTDPITGKIHGPGVIDMKGGIVAMMFALRRLNELGRLDNAELYVLFNSDEEMGSLSSNQLVKDFAKKAQIGLIFEGSPEYKMTRLRKGLGQARIKITGRASHAGAKHEDGVSANIEMAHNVLEVEKLTNYDDKVTVNVGVMNGGVKRNAIPECADAYIDLRYPDNVKGEALKKAVLEVADTKFSNLPSDANFKEEYPDLPKTDSWAILHRPAKGPHPVTDKMLSLYMGVSNSVEKISGGYIGTKDSGGGTDGSIAQSVGIPTIDSMGPSGGRSHSIEEYTSVNDMIERTKTIVVFLDRMFNSPQKDFDTMIESE